MRCNHCFLQLKRFPKYSMYFDDFSHGHMASSVPLRLRSAPFVSERLWWTAVAFRDVRFPEVRLGMGNDCRFLRLICWLEPLKHTFRKQFGFALSACQPSRGQQRARSRMNYSCNRNYMNAFHSRALERCTEGGMSLLWVRCAMEGSDRRCTRFRNLFFAWREHQPETL